MSREQFSKELERDLPSSAYYLLAGDHFLLKEACDRIRSLVPEQMRDFNAVSLDLGPADGPPVTVQTALDLLNTPGFFGGRKVVFLWNVQVMKKKEMEPLLEYLENPSPHSLLVMLSPKAPGRGMRGGLKGVKVISLDMTAQEVRAWVKGLAGERGVEMTPAAVEFLIGISGAAMGTLYSEVEKLSLLGRKRIDVDDICEAVYGTSEQSVFSLVDALIAGDRDRVFRIYDAMRGSLDPFAVLGAINWRYSEISKRRRPSERGRFLGVFRSLSEADRRLKTSGGEYPLEELFLRLLRA